MCKVPCCIYFLVTWLWRQFIVLSNDVGFEYQIVIIGLLNFVIFISRFFKLWQRYRQHTLQWILCWYVLFWNHLRFRQVVLSRNFPSRLWPHWFCFSCPKIRISLIILFLSYHINKVINYLHNVMHRLAWDTLRIWFLETL